MTTTLGLSDGAARAPGHHGGPRPTTARQAGPPAVVPRSRRSSCSWCSSSCPPSSTSSTRSPTGRASRARSTSSAATTSTIAVHQRHARQRAARSRSIYAVLVAVFQNLFGLGLALLLERDTRLNRVARVAVLHPGDHVRARRRLHLPGAAQAGGRAQRHPRRRSPGSDVEHRLARRAPPGRSSSSRSSTPGSGWACRCSSTSPGSRPSARTCSRPPASTARRWWTTFRAHPVPAARPGGHLQRRDRAARLDERLRHRAGDDGGRPRRHHRAAQHLHLPHLRAGPVRPGHDHEPRALPRGRAARLPRHPHSCASGRTSCEHHRSPAHRPPARRRRDRPASLQPVVAILAAVVLLGMPFWLVVVTAGKTQAEALNPNLSLPTQWQLVENFAHGLRPTARCSPAFLGSLLVMVPAVARRADPRLDGRLDPRRRSRPALAVALRPGDQRHRAAARRRHDRAAAAPARPRRNRGRHDRRLHGHVHVDGRSSSSPGSSAPSRIELEEAARVDGAGAGAGVRHGSSCRC